METQQGEKEAEKGEEMELGAEVDPSILDAPDSEEETSPETGETSPPRPPAAVPTPAVAAPAPSSAPTPAGPHGPNRGGSGSGFKSKPQESSVKPRGTVPMGLYRDNRINSDLSRALNSTRLNSIRQVELDSDDVFMSGVGRHSPATGPVGGTGFNFSRAQGGDTGIKQTFPPSYNIIRAAKHKRLAASRINGAFGFARPQTVKKIGYGVGTLAADGDSRCFLVQNYHCATKGLNISFSVRKPEHKAPDELACLACPSGHSHAARARDSGLPFTVIVTDQNFPPLLPAADGDCAIVIRVEDGSLSDLESVLLDRLRAYVKPHGNLPRGSVILLGSLSHLAARGLGDYAENFVAAASSIRGRLGGVEIVPLPPIPLQGVGEPHVVRALLDFDSWLGGGKQTAGCSLLNTRNLFWELVRNNAVGGGAPCESTQIHMLPTDLRNSRKIPFTSEPVDPPLPASIPPFSENMEREIVGAILRELNEEFGLELDTDPDLTRVADPVPAHDHGRTVVMGASHMRRTAQALIASGTNVVDLTVPGWSPTKDSLADLGTRIRNLNLGNRDTVVVDLWSNSALLGTDEMGFPSKPFKSAEDGKYHVPGRLQAAPATIFDRILADAAPIFEGGSNARLIVVAPFPRYVTGGCCSDGQHVSNHGTAGFWGELQKSMESAKEAVLAAGLSDTCTILNWSDVTGNTELFSTVPTLSDVWGTGDPVHLSESGYRLVAAAIISAAGQGSADGRPSKRPRLESVVPVPDSSQSNKRRIQLPAWLLGSASNDGGFTGRSPRGRGQGPLYGRGFRGRMPRRGGWRRGRY